MQMSIIKFKSFHANNLLTAITNHHVPCVPFSFLPSIIAIFQHTDKLKVASVQIAAKFAAQI